MCISGRRTSDSESDPEVEPLMGDSSPLRAAAAAARRLSSSASASCCRSVR